MTSQLPALPSTADAPSRLPDQPLVRLPRRLLLRDTDWQVRPTQPTPRLSVLQVLPWQLLDGRPALVAWREQQQQVVALAIEQKKPH